MKCARRLCTIAPSLFLLLSACSRAPSKVKGAPETPPDEQFEIGSTFADRFLIWKCYREHRVVMLQPCSPHSCDDWIVYRGACGEELPLEREHFSSRHEGATADAGDLASRQDRHPIPEGSGWR